MFLLMLSDRVIHYADTLPGKVDTVLVRDTLFIPFEYLEHIQNYYDTLSQGLIALVAIAVGILGLLGIDNLVRVRRGVRIANATDQRILALRRSLEARHDRLQRELTESKTGAVETFRNLQAQHAETESRLNNLMDNVKTQFRQTNLAIAAVSESYLTKFHFLVLSTFGVDPESDSEFIVQVLEMWIELLNTDRREEANRIEYVFLLRNLENNLRFLELDEVARRLLEEIINRHRNNRGDE